MFNMLTFEVHYLFKQSVNPPQIFRICLVVFELEVCKKIRFDFRSDIGLRRISNIRHSTKRPIESKKSDPTNKANRIEFATFDLTECTHLI